MLFQANNLQRSLLETARVIHPGEASASPEGATTDARGAWRFPRRPSLTCRPQGRRCQASLPQLARFVGIIDREQDTVSSKFFQCAAERGRRKKSCRRNGNILTDITGGLFFKCLSEVEDLKAAIETPKEIGQAFPAVSGDNLKIRKAVEESGEKKSQDVRPGFRSPAPYCSSEFGVILIILRRLPSERRMDVNWNTQVRYTLPEHLILILIKIVPVSVTVN